MKVRRAAGAKVKIVEGWFGCVLKNSDWNKFSLWHI
jgi:hypothetical protein